MGNFIGPLQNNFPRPKPLKIGFEPASLGATPRQVKSARANGVLDLTDYSCLDTVLTGTPVEKVWTVGIKTALKLKRAGIKTALALRDADISWVRQKFGVVGIRTVYELRVGALC